MRAGLPLCMVFDVVLGSAFQASTLLCLDVWRRSRDESLVVLGPADGIGQGWLKLGVLEKESVIDEALWKGFLASEQQP